MTGGGKRDRAGLCEHVFQFIHTPLSFLQYKQETTLQCSFIMIQ